MTTVFGSAPFVTVEKYTSTGCASSVFQLANTYWADGTTAADVTSITTAQDNTCVGTTKVYGSGITPIYLLSTKTFASGTTVCTTPTVPDMVTAVAVDPLTATCMTTNQCAITEATSTLCSSSASYASDINLVFPSTPFVTVELYTGSACAALASIKTYWADGNCHKKDATTSYRAVRRSDNSAKIQFYTDAACTTPGIATTDVTTITRAQDNTCVGTTKVYGSGVTEPFYLSTKTFDSATGSCTTASTPNLVVTAKGVEPVDSICKTTTTCAGTAFPFTSTLCSPASTFVADITPVFPSTPFVTVETYSSPSCATLTGIKTYWADGNCHKKDATTSYRAMRKTDKSATVQFYTDTACTTPGIATTDVTTITGGQDSTCVSNTMKVYGSGVTQDFYLSVKTYNSATGSCTTSALPNLVTAAKLSPVDATCKTTTACATSSVFTSTLCNPVGTYKSDMATVFNSNPFVIVETYDGSYTAVRKGDGSSSIQFYTDAACVTASDQTTVQSDQTTCAPSTTFKVWYMYDIIIAGSCCDSGR
uniref:Uncharacterized protein n=1 Tax=Phytophthora ramorum TaxID=164328 RepID=H3H4D8_PHYRM